MARKPRIEIENGIYHVMARGNQKRYIFLEDADYQEYVRVWKKYHRVFDFQLLAYTLMKNHVHVLVRQGTVPLSKVMKHVQQCFTQRYNRRKGKCGHVFQGRYKARYCKDDNHFLELLRYIHLNPYRKGIVKDPGDYQWTSHRLYWVGKGDGLVAVREGLSLIAAARTTAVRKYRTLIEDGMTEGVCGEKAAAIGNSSYSGVRPRMNV